MEWVINATHRMLLPHERDPVNIVQKAALALGPARTDEENLATPQPRKCKQ